MLHDRRITPKSVILAVLYTASSMAWAEQAPNFIGEHSSCEPVASIRDVEIYSSRGETCNSFDGSEKLHLFYKQEPVSKELSGQWVEQIGFHYFGLYPVYTIVTSSGRYQNIQLFYVTRDGANKSLIAIDHEGMFAKDSNYSIGYGDGVIHSISVTTDTLDQYGCDQFTTTHWSLRSTDSSLDVVKMGEEYSSFASEQCWAIIQASQSSQNYEAFENGELNKLTMSADSYDVTLKRTCASSSDCNDYTYHGVNRDSGAGIEVGGGYFDSEQKNYVFSNGNITYIIKPQGELFVYQGERKELLHASGFWEK